ncbi:MAG TPA: sulfatase-like hydrolase/transferase [Pseudomonas sp.]|nr:sulfatase-like hydrolase/transferase [Pseudomonas sp.]
MRSPCARHTLGLLLALLTAPVGAVQPDALQPSATQPSAAQPSAAQRDAAQPIAARPIAARRGAAQPNFVVLIADDWGFTDVGAYGGEMPTPNLDELAARGTRFSNFHVAASCAPTRAMLMTGVDNHRNGVGNMPETIPLSHEGQPGYLGVLDTSVVTVASLLQDSGYNTYVAGKWHLGQEPHNLPPARGFQRSLIQADSGSDNWEMRPYLLLKPDVAWFKEGEPLHELPEDFYSSTFFVDTAIAQIAADRDSGKPFFSYVAFQANHIPVQAPEHFIENNRGKYDKGWHEIRQARRAEAIYRGLLPEDTAMTETPGTPDWESLSPADKAYQARRMEVYAGMAEAMDYEVGRLISYLKDIGEYDNTVFLFLSDNGPEASDPYAISSSRLWLDWQYDRSIDRLGGKGAYSIIGPGWASAAAGPLSTYKFYAGEGGLRVPLIIAGVPEVPPEQLVHSLAHVTDIAPTLLELAGIKPPAGQYQGREVEPMIGTSLLPVLQGKAEQTHGSDKPIGYELSGNAALFKGAFKLVKNLPPIGDGQWHLFNISQDPGETDDLQQQMPELFAEMQADYAAYATANRVLPMPEGYEPLQQVQINALVKGILPRLALPLLFVLLGIAGLVYLRRRKTAKARNTIH